jgi:hypothetical protein
MKETKTSPKKINTLEANNYIITIYARPWKYEGSREVYAATINTKAGYQKGIVKWNGYLASTVQRAMEIAYA